MDRQALADRIVIYSDTVVAFALVNGFAFLISLGEPDIRCSIANVSGVASGLNVLVPVASSFALFWLRDYERSLRVEPEPGDESIASEEEASEAEASEVAEEQDEVVARFWRIAFRVRLGLIWLFSTIVLLGIYAATFDTRCAVLGG
jgi:uncharacterized ion transporter superfamily protein YfcC